MPAFQGTLPLRATAIFQMSKGRLPTAIGAGLSRASFTAQGARLARRPNRWLRKAFHA